MKKRRYLVTGAANGVGAATCQKLLSQGHTVVGIDIDPVLFDISESYQVDLGNISSVQSTLAQIKGSFDGICHVAGLPPRPGLETTILAVNFLAIRELTKCLLPQLNAEASIVNLASRAGQAWRENIDQIKRLSCFTLGDDLVAFIESEHIDATKAYNLSKEALIAWTVAQAEPMLKKNIRINSLSPGAISTGILADFNTAFGEKVALNVARAGRPGTADEAADAILYLLSDQSQWVKGADIALDGGMGAFSVTEQLGLESLTHH